MVMEVVGLSRRLKYVCQANMSTQRDNTILQAKCTSWLAILARDITKRYTCETHGGRVCFIREDQQHQLLNSILIKSWAEMIVRTQKSRVRLISK
jgi:hypothetical protein